MNEHARMQRMQRCTFVRMDSPLLVIIRRTAELILPLADFFFDRSRFPRHVCSIIITFSWGQEK